MRRAGGEHRVRLRSSRQRPCRVRQRERTDESSPERQPRHWRNLTVLASLLAVLLADPGATTTSGSASGGCGSRTSPPTFPPPCTPVLGRRVPGRTRPRRSQPDSCLSLRSDIGEEGLNPATLGNTSGPLEPPSASQESHRYLLVAHLITAFRMAVAAGVAFTPGRHSSCSRPLTGMNMLRESGRAVGEWTRPNIRPSACRCASGARLCTDPPPRCVRSSRGKLFAFHQIRRRYGCHRRSPGCRRSVLVLLHGRPPTPGEEPGRRRGPVRPARQGRDSA